MRLLPNTDFRFLVGASTASQVGDWSARLALALLIFERTDSPTAVGLVAALLVLPWLGPGQWLAVQGDRLDRRRLLVICDLTRGLVFLLIGSLDLPIPVLLGLVVIAATIDPVFEANRSALIIDIVPDDDYAVAIQTSHAINQGSQLAGFAVGGLLVAALGASGALALNGVTFLLSAWLMSRIRASSRAERSGTKPNLAQAWQFLVGDRLALVAVAATFVTVGSAMAIESQVAVYGSEVAGFSGLGIGLLAALVPAATLLAVVFLSTNGDDKAVLIRGLRLALLGSIPAGVLLTLGSNLAVIATGYALVGVVFTFSTAANIAIGRRIPAGIRAGTFAVLQALVFIATSLGSVLGGLASDLFGSRSAAGGAMVICAGSCVAAGILLHREGDGSFAPDVDSVVRGQGAHSNPD